ncbi:YdcF family protein [Paenibacillus wynnii]|uniref:YdcF family protein n=1 Tax=Paenibacillus wynnii TaxID=268407 RepID=UPI000A048660|nr:YdcF family protein [Paenibacillus wynnii]
MNKLTYCNLFNLSIHRLPLIIISISLLTFILNAGNFLFLTNAPKQADIIVLLSGDSGRVDLAADLFKAAYSPYVMLSNAEESISASGDMLQTALAMGVPQDAILTENAALSTYDNAKYTLPIMKEHGFTSAIVVSSDYHMRRVKFIFDHVYKKSGIKLTYVASHSNYNAKHWWSDSYSRETTFSEYTKMIGNALGYDGPEAKNALDQIKGWFF